MLDTTLKIAGLIDTILGIAVAVQNLRSPGKGLFSPLLTGCAIILALLIATFVIRSDNWRKYSFVKTFSYWFRRGPEDYYVREREIAFLYDSLTKFTYKKKMVLISRGAFKNYTSRWRWSKPQNLEDFNKECTCAVGQRGGVQWGRSESWYTYTVNFNPLPKGNEQTVTLKLKDLDNSDGKALPYLKADIVEHTERLVFAVTLNDTLEFDFDQLSLTVYHENMQNPILKETWQENRHKLFQYDAPEKTIKVNINHPIYGYKYVFDFPGLKTVGTKEKSVGRTRARR